MLSPILLTLEPVRKIMELNIEIFEGRFSGRLQGQGIDIKERIVNNWQGGGWAYDPMIAASNPLYFSTLSHWVIHIFSSASYLHPGFAGYL